MIGVSAEIDLGQVIKGFNGMKVKSRDMRSAWRELKPMMRKDIRGHNKQLRGPDGAWLPLDPDTLAQRKGERKKSKSGSTLKKRKDGAFKRRGKVATRILGRLRTGFGIEVAPLTMTARSHVKWSLAHQDGDIVGRDAEVPSRPFMWVTDAFMKKATEVVVKHVLKGFK